MNFSKLTQISRKIINGFNSSSISQTRNNSSLNFGGNTSIDYSLDYTLLRQLLLIECVLATLSFLMNVVVVLTFVRMISNQRKKRSNMIFLMQAATDLIVTMAIIIDVIFYYSFYNSVLMPPQFFITWWFFFGYSQILALNTLLLITIERLVAIKFPIHHRFHATTRNTVIALCITYSISTSPAIVFIFHIWPLFLPSYSKFKTLAMKYVICTSTVSLLIIMIVFSLLFVAYSSIRRSIQKRIRQHSSLLSKTNVHISRFIHREKKKHRRIIAILVIVCSIYSVTYLPLTVYRICYYPLYDYITEAMQMILYNSFVLLYFSSALLNPVVTLFFNLDYRKRLLQFFVGKRKTPGKTLTTSRLFTTEIEMLLKRTNRETNV